MGSLQNEQQNIYKSKMVLQFSPGSGVCKMLCEFSEGCVKHKIIQWIENRKAVHARCLLMRSDFMHRVRALEVNVHGFTETHEMLWPCLAGLGRPLREPSHVCFASAVVCCYRAAALWHDTLMNRLPPCHTPAGQQSYWVSASRTQERQTKTREKQTKWNETKPAMLDYLKYPSACIVSILYKNMVNQAMAFIEQ